MNNINISFKDNENKYITIYKQIKKMITSSTLKANEKLPSKRDFASNLNVSNNTIMNAYNLLLDEGYIYTKEKSGYYVSDNRYYNLKSNNTYIEEEKKVIPYDFTSENIDSTIFPFYTIRKLTQKIMMDNPNIWLSKSNYQGDINLRQSIASYLYENKGMEVNANNVIIVSSLEESFRIISSLIDIKNVGFENPTYKKAYSFFKDKNIYLYDVDDKGIVLNEKHELDLLYVTPYNQFPTGVKMSISRRNQLLSYPVKYIFEDDFDCDLISSNKVMSTLFSLNNEKVIFHGSFSHTICPGLRISYLVLPNNLIEKYKKMYSHSSSEISSLDQALVSLFLSEGYYYRHIHNIKKNLKKKKEMIRDYLIKHHVKYDETELSFLIDNIKYNHQLIKIHSMSEYYINDIKSNKLIINYSSIPENKIINGLDELTTNIHNN